MPDLDEQLTRARLTNRRLLIATATLSALAVMASFVLGYFRFQDAASSSSLQCARNVAQPFTDLRDARDDATGDELDAIAQAVVQSPSTVDREALRVAVLDAADRRAAAKHELKKLGPQSQKIMKEC